MNNVKIVIATIKPWNIKNTDIFRNKNLDKYEIFIISKKEDLTEDNLSNINPEYVFFPHWSWIISSGIHKKFKCIVFHMTDLPYGRGGSPLQNLISNKVYDTKISAIEVEDGLDTGRVYMKEPFYIGTGSAQEIFQKISETIFFKMIPQIIETNPILVKQEGQPVNFKRRRSEQSDILSNKLYTLEDFYDFVRMLDADSYPKAFFKIDNLKLEFSRVQYQGKKLVGTFEVLAEKDKNEN